MNVRQVGAFGLGQRHRHSFTARCQPARHHGYAPLGAASCKRRQKNRHSPLRHDGADRRCRPSAIHAITMAEPYIIAVATIKPAAPNHGTSTALAASFTAMLTTVTNA